MAKVFIVTSGCYSDYSVDAVFLDEIAANNYVAQHNDPNEKNQRYGFRVEAWDTETKTYELPVGKRAYEVVISRDGIYSAARETSYVSQARYNSTAFFYYGTPDDDYEWPDWAPAELRHQQFMSTSVLATDEKHAVKIGAERRTFILATNQWPGCKSDPGLNDGGVQNIVWANE